MTEPTENERPKKVNENRRRVVRRTLITGGAFIVGFIIFGVIAIQVWEYSNSVSFCANACHDVHPEEIPAFQDSFHANVKCTECHMGRVGTIRSILLKAGHFRHLPEVIFDQYERPLESETMRPANESCELCHWPPAFHGDTVREIVSFLPDEENTEKRTYLILKTGAGTREVGLGYGVHWHVTAPVEYIATDEHGREIPWVRTTLPDGRTVEYQDVSNPLSPEEIEQAEKHLMDCVDCHNRVGHPFPPPEDLIDMALAEGRVSRELPYAKKTMADLLTSRYETREDALASVGLVREEYEAQYPEVAAAKPEAIDQAEEVTKELVTRVVFEEPGVTWENFPDHSGHKEFAGCFRCHNGKHQTEDGETIRLHCNICHSVPVSVGEGDRVPQLPVASIQEPASHLESNFMADHRFQASSACESCHGEIEFGSDDSSFCANSSCHGLAWPEVDLDAAFAHPIPLEGGHAEVWCHDCHEGVRQPVFECANCHEPPTDPHFGEECEDCHTPFGWDQVDLGEFQHPILLEGAHAQASCIDCHAEQVEGLEYVCANCHQPPTEPHFGPSCEDCHTPTSFSEATLPPELHPVPLEGAHAEADCESCHTDPDADLDYICADCHEPPENHLEGSCDACHSPDGFVESASFLVGLAPEIPHGIAGRDDCLLCHDPDGDIQPAPSNHDYENEQCTLCHKLED
ncbi:MAG: cytochrome c3 family protein [Anaerolineae bacterium]|nr:cytochrome c3 family protein [Anaerolineae bacterium]